MASNSFLKEEYRLTENPFLDGRASDRWLNTWVDREKELKEWRRVLAAARRGKVNQIVFIIGEYGRGKSLSLLKVRQEAVEFTELRSLYLNFQSEQKPKNPGLDFLQRILRTVLSSEIFSKLTPARAKSYLDGLPEGMREVSSVLEKSFDRDSNIRQTAKYFVSGQIRASRTQLETLGALRNVSDVEIAKEYLAGVLFLAKKIGIETLVFGIDEFEYLFSLVSKSQRTIYIALLRGLFDFPIGLDEAFADITKLAFFIAISEDGWRSLNEMEKLEREQGGPIRPLFRRLSPPSTLMPLNRNETRELITKRLSLDRVKGKVRSRPLIPFQDDFVKFVFEKTHGEPSQIIKICAHVLDAGLEKGAKILSGKFAEQIVRERNL